MYCLAGLTEQDEDLARRVYCLLHLPPAPAGGCGAADPAQLRARLAGGQACAARSSRSRTCLLFAAARAVIADNPRPRGASRVARIERPDEGEDGGPTGLSNELAMAIGRLHGRERDALALRFGAELSIGEIAELLDRTPAEVKQRLARGVRGLIELGVLPKESRARSSAAKRPGAGGAKGARPSSARPATRASDDLEARSWGGASPSGPAATRASSPAPGAGRCARSSSPDAVEALRLRPVDVGIELVGEAPRLACDRQSLGGGQPAPQPVGDRGERGDGEQEREEGAHSAFALGRGDGLGSASASVRLSLVGGPVGVGEVGRRLALRPSAFSACAARPPGSADPPPAAVPAAISTRAAAAAVRGLLEVLVALGRSRRDRDRRRSRSPASARRPRRRR